ncbi:SulP family inorganic anion transporter [Sphaerotilaceae bacterium SBD11-9]
MSKRSDPWLLGWLRRYDTAWLKPDVVAGLVVAAIVIPKALAYATIAGLPVQVGLYTALVPMAIYALFGASRQLSVSTTTTIAILTGAALASVATSGQPEQLLTACATLTVLVGVILTAAGLLRLGFIANFISEPVLVGFKAGIGVVIIVDQLPKLLGVHIDKGSFLHNVWQIVQHVPETSWPTPIVALATIGLLVGIERFAERLPAPLVAVAAAIAAMSFLGLDAHGVTKVGDVPTGLPSITLPSLSLLSQLWPAALGIALMSFTETVAAGRAFARRGDPLPEANRELLATGLATAGGGLLGAMPAGGGTSQTAVNAATGARSQLAGLVTAATSLAVALLLAPLIGQMPNATLAAVVVVYSVGLVKPAEFSEIGRIRRTEFVWALVALAGVVLLGTLQGIVVAIVVSLLALAYQASDPPVHVLGRKLGTNVFRPLSEEKDNNETFAGLLMLRPEGRIFFVNAERLGQKMRRLIDDASPRVVILHLRSVVDLEYTALKMLIAAEKRMRDEGVALWLVGLNPGVLEMVRRSSLGDTLGRERMYFNLEQALAAYQTGGTAITTAPQSGPDPEPEPG